MLTSRLLDAVDKQVTFTFVTDCAQNEGIACSKGQRSRIKFRVNSHKGRLQLDRVVIARHVSVSSVVKHWLQLKPGQGAGPWVQSLATDDFLGLGSVWLLAIDSPTSLGENTTCDLSQHVVCKSQWRDRVSGSMPDKL